MNIIRLCAIAAIALASSTVAMAAPTSITIPMKALNGSNQIGTAVVTQQADGVKVVVSLKNASASAEPTHIHVGTCAKINAAPEYPLSNTVNGKSTSVVKGIKLADLLKSHYAINVHKSATEIATYVSCGDIASK